MGRAARAVLALFAGLLGCQGGDAPASQHRGKLELIEAPIAAPAGPPQDVAALVVAQLARAARDHRHVVVYVGATWCEPCLRFHDAAQRGELDAEFPDVTVLAFDADRAGEALERASYRSELIPLFAIPRPDGTASGQQIEGSIKGDAAVGQIAPRLRALVDQVAAAR
jgi:thiol-disulfide isomerase/thioredoxin